MKVRKAHSISHFSLARQVGSATECARVTRVVRGQAGELAVRREVAARGVASGRVSGI